MKKIFIRTDANENIGIGHIMRCITIAKEMKNIKCVFVVSDEKAYNLIKENNFDVICLNIDYRDYGKIEAKKIIDIGIINNIDLIMVDSYYVDCEYLCEIKKHFKVVCFNSRDIFLPANIVINYNINCDKKLYKKLYRYTETTLLLGCEYVPLREEFITKRTYTVRQNVNQILIMTGGTDKYNFMGKLARTICNNNIYDDIKFVFVSGKYNVHIKELVGYESKKENITVVEDVNNISQLMAESDLVISAGGTTLYELCVIGVPSIIFSIADNQDSETKYFGESKVIKYIGKCGSNQFDVIFMEGMDCLIHSYTERKCLSDKMKLIIDGYGASRIARQIEKILK